jgi:hypothetical protein
MSKMFWKPFFILLLSILLLILPVKVQAVNQFGIHVLEPTDLPRAQELVNSQGGDWGWVTVVIRDDDRHRDKWQDFMNQCRERHLVPLVRLATHLEGDTWKKPELAEAKGWVDFLNSLNWPVQERYVILFNEPNQAKEWGGEVNPGEYAQVWEHFCHLFKEANSNFQVLNAGLDLAAPDSAETMRAESFLGKMLVVKPEMITLLDGWVSHSYPNHGFLGKPSGQGPTSIRGYQWELNFLREKFGLKQKLPIFITETGWPKDKEPFYDQNEVANYLEEAYRTTWLVDKRIMAITPFVLNYPGENFRAFSWLDEKGQPYPQFGKVKGMSKESWQPAQEEKAEVVSFHAPLFLVAGKEFKGRIILKNVGQSIWAERGDQVWPAQAPEGFEMDDLVIPDQRQVKPGETVGIRFILKPQLAGEFEFGWVDLPSKQITVLENNLLSGTRLSLWEIVVMFSRKWLGFI